MEYCAKYYIHIRVICLNTLKKLSYFVNIVKWMFFYQFFWKLFQLDNSKFLYFFICSFCGKWYMKLNYPADNMTCDNQLSWVKLNLVMKIMKWSYKISLWEFKFGYYGSSCISWHTQFFWGVTFRATVYYNDLYTLSPAFMFSHTLSQIISIIYMHIYIYIYIYTCMYIYV